MGKKRSAPGLPFAGEAETDFAASRIDRRLVGLGGIGFFMDRARCSHLGIGIGFFRLNPKADDVSSSLPADEAA
jgi:hypothetical protein